MIYGDVSPSQRGELLDGHPEDHACVIVSARLSVLKFGAHDVSGLSSRKKLAEDERVTATSDHAVRGASPPDTLDRPV